MFEAVKRSPERFAGFATLPTPDPAAAARELERTVKELRFCGAMVHGSTRGHFLDERQFWPILESAQALDVPIYLHPCTPQPAVFETYYKDYPQLGRAALGFGIEMAVQAARLIVSGAFDEFPRLKIILGHLGETLPFVLWRADDTLSRRAKLRRSFREYFVEHFYITTAGNFSQPGAAMRDRGARRRAHPVRGRLAVPAQRRGGRVRQRRPSSRPARASKYSAPTPAGCCASEFARHNAPIKPKGRSSFGMHTCSGRTP